MDLIYKPRMSGKTTELIQRAAKDWLYIVCLNRREVERVAEEASRMGQDIPFPITFKEFVRGEFSSKHGRIKGFLIDNVDVMLAHAARGVPVVAVTMTLEEPVKLEDED